MAQGQQISGRVIADEDGEPIIGASVMMKGGRIGTTTDADGRFQLNLPPTAKTLVISFVGMKTKEVTVKPNLVIVLATNNEELGEVVVTGMQKVDRRIFSGAATKLESKDVKIDGMADISRSLQGHVAGVSVQNVTGTFGTAPKIRVRGATSIYGSSTPLWVVDGVIVEPIAEVHADDLSSGDTETLLSSAIAGLNAEDVESMQILKDGSATSIYGARAMAGVIVITTKKGTAGQTRVNYTGEFTYRHIPTYSEYNIMNSQEQMGVYREMQQKGWLNFAESYRSANSGVYGKMYHLMNSYDSTTGTFGLPQTETAMNNYLREAEFRNTNWFDELFNQNIMENHSVSVSSGTDKATFYASLSVMDDPGWTLSSRANRYTANLNTTVHLSKKLDLSLISMGSYVKQKAPGTLGQTTDPVFGEVKRDFDINPYNYAMSSSRTLDSNTFYTRNYADFNIIDELNNNYTDKYQADLKFQAELKYRPFNGLELTALAAVKYNTASIEHTITDDSNQSKAYRAMDDSTIRKNNPFLYDDPEQDYDLPISVLPKGGFYQRTDHRLVSSDFRATATYNTTINEDHVINAFAGMESSGLDRRRSYFNGVGMQYNMGEIPYYIYEFFKQSVEEGTDYYSLSNTTTRTAAFFANATYAYKGRYALNGTFRYDGSNRLGKARSARWLPTWNVSGIWNASEEKFWEPIRPYVSTFALKASYSLTGDTGPSSVSNAQVVISSYNPYRPTESDKQSGLQITDLANSELTYEKKHEFNIGTEIGLFNNRISIEADWYKRNNYDLIGDVFTAGVGGQIAKMANVASMKSHGFEFSLSAKTIKRGSFSWTTNVIYSLAKNKVTDLKSETQVMQLVSGVGFALEGYPQRGLFSYKFNGLTEDGLPMLTDQDGNDTSDGYDFDFQSENLENLVYEGPTDPTFQGSLGNIFTWKGWRLNVYITYAGGNVIRLDPFFNSTYSDLDAMPKEFKNRWTISGDENITSIPVILSNRQTSNDRYLKTLYNAYNYSTARVAKGDYIRMSELSLQYEFPRNWISKLNLNNLSLKVQATNPFLFYASDRLNGEDPEFVRSGGVSNPVPKQYTLTLRLGI